jgi:hypothetical protein
MTLRNEGLAKLDGTRAPFFPYAKEQYSREEMDYFINMLRQYFIQNDRFTGSLIDNVGGAYLNFPYGSFHQDGNTTLSADIGNGTTTPIPVVSTAGFLSAGGLIIEDEIITYTGKTDTTFTGITRGTKGTSSSAHTAGTAVSEAQTVTVGGIVPLAFTATDSSNDVYIDPTNISRIVFVHAGRYNIQFSTQLINYTTAEDNVTMWFRRNGVDVPYSAGIVSVIAKHSGQPGTIITSWNIILDMEANHYLEMMMTSNTGNTVVATYPPGTSPVHPVAPSIILTATFVSRL